MNRRSLSESIRLAPQFEIVLQIVSGPRQLAHPKWLEFLRPGLGEFRTTFPTWIGPVVSMSKPIAKIGQPPPVDFGFLGFHVDRNMP